MGRILFFWIKNKHFSCLIKSNPFLYPVVHPRPPLEQPMASEPLFFRLWRNKVGRRLTSASFDIYGNFIFREVLHKIYKYIWDIRYITIFKNQKSHLDVTNKNLIKKPANLAIGTDNFKLIIALSEHHHIIIISNFIRSIICNLSKQI